MNEKEEIQRRADYGGLHPIYPAENAYIERYNRTVRHEWLDRNIFESIVPLGECKHSPAGQREAQEQATNWHWTHNNDRPDMAIGGITPAMKLKQAA